MNKTLKNYHLRLTLVGAEKKERLKDKNIKIIKQVNNDKKLKKYMILINFHITFLYRRLSSGNFREVIKKKPVIIFNEIKFLKKFIQRIIYFRKK